MKPLIFLVLFFFISPLQHAYAQYPAKSGGKSILEGAIDIHMHTSPDVFERSVTDFEVAKLAEKHKMKALVIKNHLSSTAARVELVNYQSEKVKLFGGITLNHAVGGINPKAVQAMVDISPRYGKFVWFPTIDAACHKKAFGMKSVGGISILDKKQKLIPEVLEIIDIIYENDLVLASGHISTDEIDVLVKQALGVGIKKILINHPLIEAPGMSIEQMTSLAEQGVFIELTYLSYLSGPQSPLDFLKGSKHVSIEKMLELIQHVGAKQIILSSDLGQSGNPTPPDGFKNFVEILLKHGVSVSDIKMMIIDNPSFLLGLQ